jgi:hypothetical protein
MSVSTLLHGEESKKNVNTNVACHSLDTYELKAENFIMIDNKVETPIYRGMVETINDVYTWDPVDAFQVYYDIKGDTIGSRALYMKKGRSFKIVYGLTMTYSGPVQGGTHLFYFNFDGDVKTQEIEAGNSSSGELLYTMEFYVSDASDIEATIQYTLIALNPTNNFSYSRVGSLVLPLVDNVTHVQNVYYKFITPVVPLPQNPTRIRYLVERIA